MNLISRGPRWVAIGAAIGALPAAGAIAYASIPDPSGAIHGCYNSTTGSLRVIDPSATHDPNPTKYQCLTTVESAISWNQTGPQGLKGDTGGTGAPGPQGESGATGPKGDKGDPGAAGVSDAKELAVNYANVPNGDETPVATMPLTSGKWMITAHGTVQNYTNDAVWGCKLQAGGTTIDDANTKTQSGASNIWLSEITLDAVADLPSDGDVQMLCFSGKTNSAVVGIKLVALKLT